MLRERTRHFAAAVCQGHHLARRLALRELAKEQLKITREELDDAFESEFGPAVKVRLIAWTDPRQARSVHAQPLPSPRNFRVLAKNHSKDPNSASAYGLIQPIRRHSGDPELEASGLCPEAGRSLADRPRSAICTCSSSAKSIFRRARASTARSRATVWSMRSKNASSATAANDVFKQLQDRGQDRHRLQRSGQEQANAGRGRHDQRPDDHACRSWPKSALSATAKTCWKARSIAGCWINRCVVASIAGRATTRSKPRSHAPRWHGQGQPTTASRTSPAGSSTSRKRKHQPRSLRARRSLAVGGA